MELLELLILGSGFFLLCLAVFVPLGHLLARCCISSDDSLLHLLLAPAISSIGFSLLVVSLCLVDQVFFDKIHNQNIGNSLLLFCAVVFAIWITSGAWRDVLRKDLCFGLLVIFFCWLALLVHVCFPYGNFRQVTSETVMYLSNLPVDNIISYNVGRFITERLDPNTLDVVPLWKATDRGPIAGIISAGFQLMLGLEDRRPWLWTGVGSGFVYQGLLMFLNLLSLFGVWLIALRWKGLKLAASSALILLSMAFFLLNIFFTWPKFFMAYVLMAAWALWPYRKDWWLLGVLLGLALLTHNSAMFFVLSFGFLLLLNLWQTLYQARQAKNAAIWVYIKHHLSVILGAAALFFPWIWVKVSLFPSSPRLIHLQLFCNYDPQADRRTVSEGAAKYFSENSFAQILEAKWANLAYPLSLTDFTNWVFADWPNLLPQIFGSWYFMFSRLVVAISIPALIVVVYAFTTRKREGLSEELSPYIWSCIGAYLLASIILGCPGATVNHHWAYPVFLTMALLFGLGFCRGGVLIEGLTALAVIWNGTFLVLLLFFAVEAKPGIYASNLNLATQALLYLLAVLLCIFSLQFRIITEKKEC